jgi:hypothetical protein
MYCVARFWLFAADSGAGEGLCIQLRGLVCEQCALPAGAAMLVRAVDFLRWEGDLQRMVWGCSWSWPSELVYDCWRQGVLEGWGTKWQYVCTRDR